MRIIGKNLEATRETSVVASGTIESGISVVVNSDGTVSAVSETNVSSNVGTDTNFNNSNTIETSAAYDSTNNKVVLVYRDYLTTNYGMAIVGTVSGTSISFGTEVTFNTGTPNYTIARFDESTGKVVIVFGDGSNSNYGTAIVGTVSGTSISFGSKVVFNSAEAQSFGLCYESTAQKMVITYRDEGDSNNGNAIVGTVSGTSISFGSEATFDTDSIANTRVAYDSNAGKVVVAYRNSTESNRGYAAVGTVSGTSISFGTRALFNGGTGVTSNIDIAYDENAQKVVIAYKDGANFDNGGAIVGTVSGTSISFGSEAEFSNGTPEYISLVYHAAAKKVVINYEDTGNSQYGTAKACNISGTSLTFDSAIIFKDAEMNYTAATYDSTTEQVVVAYRDNDNSNNGYAVVYQIAYTSQNLTAENFVGMARGRTISESETTGSLVEYHSTDTRGNNIAYDAASGKFVVIFNPGPPTSSPPNGYAIVGTVDPSDNSITYGTAVQFEDGEVYGDYMGITYDSNAEKVVITYMDNGDSNNTKAIVGTVSGTSISFGTPTTFNGQSQFLISTFDSTNNKVVVAYKDASNSDYGTAIVGTVSGTSISFGSKVVFNSGNTNNIGICFDSTNDKIIIGYRDQALNQQATAIVGTVSGTSISFGSEVQVSPNSATDCVPIYDPVADKIVFVYSDSSDSNKGTVKIGTVSGTSISFGDAVTFDATSYDEGAGIFDTKTSKVTIAYKGASGYPYIISGTVSGSTMTFGDPVQLGSFAAAGYRFGCAYDSATYKIASVFIDSDATPDTGESIIFNNSYTERETVATDGNALIIDTQGAINTAQASLTAGQSYYAQTDGTLSTTAGDPSVFVGTAVSSTKLIVKG